MVDVGNGVAAVLTVPASELLGSKALTFDFSFFKRLFVMFMGEYSHSIDMKGRLIIPSKFRELLGDEFVLTKGLDGCLTIYPMDEWKIFEKKLETLPLTSKNARKFVRFFIAGATLCEVDRQGRILVPQTLREFAGLEKEVILTGNLNRIEVWSKAMWEENNNYDDMDAIAEEMQNLGIGF